MPFPGAVLSTANLASNMAGIGFLGMPFCARSVASPCSIDATESAW